MKHIFRTLNVLEGTLEAIMAATGAIPKDWQKFTLLELNGRIFDTAHKALNSQKENEMKLNLNTALENIENDTELFEAWCTLQHLVRDNGLGIQIELFPETVSVQAISGYGDTGKSWEGVADMLPAAVDQLVKEIEAI